MRRWMIVALAIAVGASALMWLDPLVPSPAHASGDSTYGLDFVSAPGTVANSTRLGQAAATGVGWDRFPLYWNIMQASRSGSINFSATDATLNADLAQGIAVDGVLVGAPSWATSSGQIDLGAWSSFVSQTVAHYRGRIHAWEMWNEPDLLDANGHGVYWTWGVPAYYQLLKAGYVAAKSADPSVTVLLGGLAFPYNNQNFFPQFLDQLGQDPSAATNNGYFDVLPFHSYDRIDRMYELPLGYLGSPSFAGFRPLLRAHGLSPAIWVNELGVPIWDYGTGQKAPGRSTQDEQGSYFVESLADGLASGVDHFFAFQLYDDGAGAVDPRTNQPAEYFGLVSNGGAIRPGYSAFQSAISLFSGVQAATHLTVGRGSNYDNHKGVEVVTLYGTNRGKVTVAWNDDPGNAVTLAIPTNDPEATLVDKFGHTLGQISAANGLESVTLPGATNNNNFDCYTPHGCDANDYIIGGSPVILVENDPEVPPISFDPLPLDSLAPVALSWRATSSAGVATSYDVQFRDAADGVWHDWLRGTSATSALFGDGSMRLQGGHNYEFRLRSFDPNGNLLGGWDYPSRPLASTQIIGGNIVLPPNPIDARIEILWPHDNQPVAQAKLANITAALYRRGTTTSVNPRTTDTLRLWRALDNGVGQPVANGSRRTATAGTLNYPLWDFNDVDVSAARDPSHRYYFWVTDDSQKVNSTIWSHGVDARTFFPQQDVPASVLSQSPAAIDAKIEIVWPHANASVSQATQVNVGVELFAHGTLQSLPSGFNRQVELYRGVNSGGLEPVALGDLVLQTTGGITYPTWQFNDVDVSTARDPNNRVYFRVDVPGVTTYSNVWTHGVDARTNFPRQDVPSATLP